jgi:sugar phosphate isomerase/epimerase
LPEGQYLYGNLLPSFDKSVAFSEGPWRYCVPGDGIVDWSRVASRLELHGYHGPIAIELEDFRFAGTLERNQAGVSKAIAHLKRAIA